MTDPVNDAFAALRRADPAPVASSADPAATAAQLEEIIMTAQTERPEGTSTGAAGASPSPRLPQRRWIAVGALVTAVAAVVGVAVLAGDDGSAPLAAPSTTAVPGPVTPGGLGMCVATYDLTTLADRELALDGTVAAIDGDHLTLAVNRWFRGGDGDHVTLEGASGFSGLTANGDLTLAVGDRVLVAGDGGFAWSCGFTQAYDPAVAADWAKVLGG